MEPDCLWAELLSAAVSRTWPKSPVMAVHSVKQADVAIRSGSFDMLIADVIAIDGDAVDAVVEWSFGGALADGVFVVTAHKEPVVLDALAGSPIRGVFDQTNESLPALDGACSALSQGGSYWSSTVCDAILRTCRSQDSVFRKLTFTEQVVMGVIGDGRDDEAAATELGMSAKTVMTMRRNLHRKLGIQHKGDLVRFAISHGFVLMTPYGIVRPGLDGRLSERRSRFRKKHAVTVVQVPGRGRWSSHLAQVA